MDCPGDKQVLWGMIEIPGNIPLCMQLGPLWQSCHDWITHMSVCMVFVVMTDNITFGTFSHV